MKRFITGCVFFFFVNAALGQFSLYLESKIPVSSEKVTSVQVSSDGRFLAFGDKKGNVSVWDIGSRRLLHQLREHNGQVNALVFDTKQQRLISGGEDRSIAVWDLYSGRQEKVINDFRSSVGWLALSPDDRFLAASGNQKEILLWEFPLGTLKGSLKGHDKDVLAVAFSVNGDQLLSVSEDRQMVVWNVAKLEIVRKTSMEARTMKGSGLDIKSAAFSFDRQFVGVGIQEHMLAKGGRSMIFKYNLSFYDWKTGGEIETLIGNRKDIEFFAISPDKNYVITDNSTLQKNELSFWNIQTGVIVQNYPMDGKISAMAISEDGKWLAVAYQDAQNAFQSYVNVWQLSGISGYERFATSSVVKSTAPSGFGGAIKITTPEEPLIRFGERKRLAVLYFDSPGLDEEIARTTSYLLEGKLGNSPFVEMVERNQIQKVLEELRYQQSGFTTSDAVEVGKHLNAEYILIGSINKLGSLLIITAKLVNVETSQIEGTREVQCSNATIENISDMVSVLAPTIAKY